MRKRQLLKSMMAASLLPQARWLRADEDGERKITPQMLQDIRTGWRKLAPGTVSLPQPSDTVSHSDDEWRKQLTEPEYEVMREEDTERPFSSPLNDEHRDGLYLCAGCGLPLFTSAMKFDSGTGWPSFFTSIPGSMDTKFDLVLLIPRTEYHCIRCGSHQGHVFEDGPEPTGERWCNNGVALDFLPASGQQPPA